MNNVEVLDTILERYNYESDNVIQILSKLQEQIGYLPKELLITLAKAIKVPLSKIYGLITFYSFFSLNPPAEYHIQICMGTACHVRGAAQNADRLKSKIDIDFGETSSDNLFSLESVSCLGCCALAPVVKINDEIHGEMTPDKLMKLIDNITEQTE